MKADLFFLDKKIAIITGGAGLLGRQHAEAIAEIGGIPVLWDINEVEALSVTKHIKEQYGVDCHHQLVDITNIDSIKNAAKVLIDDFGSIDILINNAACDPKVTNTNDRLSSRFEHFPLDRWQFELSVGLTGALQCSQVCGSYMAKQHSGAIINIASDLGIIAPDQRIYRDPSLAEDEQPVKPVTYSVIKHGLIGLTKYISTYWADKGVRCNSLAPAGVYQNQPDEFVQRLTHLIPMGRMAEAGEYKGAIQFLASDASRYMTGSILTVDGGRSCW